MNHCDFILDNLLNLYYRIILNTRMIKTIAFAYVYSLYMNLFLEYTNNKGNFIMAIKYYKLFDLLARQGKKKINLLRVANISIPTLAKLSKGESVTTDILNRICAALKCQPSDIMECIPNMTGD